MSNVTLLCGTYEIKGRYFEKKDWKEIMNNEVCAISYIN